MGFVQQFFEIIERAEHRVNVAIVRHVIAEIFHRGGEEGRNPNAIDA